MKEKKKPKNQKSEGTQQTLRRWNGGVVEVRRGDKQNGEHPSITFTIQPNQNNQK
jgi:hypothetical protein